MSGHLSSWRDRPTVATSRLLYHADDVGDTKCEETTAWEGRRRSASKQRLLLLEFRQSALQIIHTFLQTLIVQTQKIQAIQ